MDSANGSRPTVPQPQSSEGLQRKRARTPTQSDIGNSSRHMEVGSTSQSEGTQKSPYEAWTDATQAQLFEWLELPGNYEKWKCAGVRTSIGSTRTSGLTKKAVTCIISEYLSTLQTKKTREQVMSKMRYVEKKFKEAEDYLRNTGEGLTSHDEKLGITVIREKVLSICPFYFQVKRFMSESAAINPPYIGESSTTENIEEMLFGTSTGEGLYKSVAPELVYGNDQQDDSSADEEPNFEEEIHVEQEQTPRAPFEGSPPGPETSQRTPNPPEERREKRRKPKSLQEALRDMQEQNRVLMEKKLEMQGTHQEDKLRFLREQSQNNFALQSRRLDLEFMRMEQQREQQREDSRIRELALQVELQKLRGNL